MNSNLSRYDALIVGAGHGGVEAAGALRRHFTRGRALIGTTAPRDREVLGDASRALVASL